MKDDLNKTFLRASGIVIMYFCCILVESHITFICVIY